MRATSTACRNTRKLHNPPSSSCYMQFHLTAAKTNETQATLSFCSRQAQELLQIAYAYCLARSFPNGRTPKCPQPPSPQSAFICIAGWVYMCVCKWVCVSHSLWSFVYFIPSFVNCHYFVMVNPLCCGVWAGFACSLGLCPSGAATAAWANCQSPVIGLAKCLTPLYNCSSVSNWPTRFFSLFCHCFLFPLGLKMINWQVLSGIMFCCSSAKYLRLRLHFFPGHKALFAFN